MVTGGRSTGKGTIANDMGLFPSARDPRLLASEEHLKPRNSDLALLALRVACSYQRPEGGRGESLSPQPFKHPT